MISKTIKVLTVISMLAVVPLLAIAPLLAVVPLLAQASGVIPAHSGQGRVTTNRESCKEISKISVHCGSVPSAVFYGGNLWVVFVQGNFVWLTISADSGKTFSGPVQVNNAAQQIYTNGENRPKISVQNNYVYVSWTEKTVGRYTGNIRFARSIDGGKTFSAAVKINDDNLLTSHRFDAMHVSENGRIYLTWLDKRDKEKAERGGENYPGSAIYFALSDDFGKSFGKNKKIADHSCECCRIALDAAGDFAAKKSEVVVLWRQIFMGSVRDHALITIGPAGATDELQRATVDEWEINACPHHGPDIATDETIDGYHLAWFSDGVRHQGLYYGFNSARKTKHIKQMDSSAGASHPQVTVARNKIYYAWKVFDGSKTSIKLKVSDDHGITWSKGRTVATTNGNSDYPLLFKTVDGEAALIWHSMDEGFRVFNLG